MKKDFNRIGATLCSSMRPRSATTSWLNKFKLLALVLTTMLSVNVWGATVTYSASTMTSSAWAISTSGTAPTGSSVSCTQTYGTFGQATKGNSFTMTLSNFSADVTKLTFSLHSNSKDGKGNLGYSVDGGSEVFLVGTSSSSEVAFNQWGDNSSYGSSYRDVNFDVTISPKSSLVIYVRCVTTNSIYFNGLTITYTVAAADPYTVTFNAGSGTCSKSSLKEASAGAGVTLPTASPSSSCATAGWTFAGWKETSAQTETTSAPTLYAVGSNYKPSANCTLYAVYSKTESGGSGTTFSEYQQVALGGTIADGKYLISNGSYTMAGSGKTGASFSPSTTEATAKEYTITTLGSGVFTIKGPDNKYVGGSTGSTTLSFSENTPSDNNYKWTYNSTGINFQGQTTRYLRANGTTDFRNYTSSGGGTTTYLYKRVETSGGTTTTYNSNPDCGPSTYTVDFVSGSNGSVSSPSIAGLSGEQTITINGNKLTIGSTTITANPNSGYKFNNWTNGGSVVTNGQKVSGTCTITANFVDIPKLTTPTGLSVSNITSSGATLSWNTVANATSYEIILIGDDSHDDPINVGNTNTYNLTDLTASTDYLWAVKAKGTDVYCDSEESDPEEFTTIADNKFKNGETIFFRSQNSNSEGNHSAWWWGACVKAWFHNPDNNVVNTTWLNDGNGSYKMFYTIVPASGSFSELQVQRFADNCNTWWGEAGDLTQSARGEKNTIASWSTDNDNKFSAAWHDDIYSLNIRGSIGSWNSDILTLADAGAGVFTGSTTYKETANTSEDFRVRDSEGIYFGTDGNSHDNTTLSGMKVGSTYTIDASFNLSTRVLTMTKTITAATVTFDMQGHGSQVAAKADHPVNTKISAPTDPSATGWYFDGWYTAATGGTKWNFGSDNVTESMVLYAHWTQISYTLESITVKTTPSKMEYNVGETLNTAGMVLNAHSVANVGGSTKDEDVTSGFTCSPTALNTAGNQTITVTYNGKTTTFTVTVYDLYTVTLKDDDTELKQSTHGGSVTLPSRTTSCAGYTFEGWSTTHVTTETSTRPTIIAAGSYTPTTDIELWPVFSKGNLTPTNDYARLSSTNQFESGAKYVITYATSKALDAAEFVTNSGKTDYWFAGASISVSNNTISNPSEGKIWTINGNNTDGYTFYTTYDDGSGIGYDDEVTQDIMLYGSAYPDFEISISEYYKAYITVKTSLTGGETKYFYGISSGAYFETSTSEGYVNLYKQQMNGSSVYIAEPECYETTITLAKGTNGKTDGSATAAKGSSTLSGYTAAVGPDHYHLLGYYDGDTKVIDASGHLVANAGSYTDGSANWQKQNAAVTLTAKWEVNSHTLTWDLDGGTAGTGTITPAGSVAYGTVLQYTVDPTKAGKKFNGWSPEMISGTTTMPDNDQTYTAQWRDIVWTDYLTDCGEPYTWTIYYEDVNEQDGEGHNVWKDAAITDGQAQFTLAKESTFNFKLRKTNDEGVNYTYYGCSGGDYTTSGMEWTLDGGSNVHVITGAAGTYTINVSALSETYPKISITYPTAYQITYAGGDGASGEMSSTTNIAAGENVALPTPDFNKTDWNCIGWTANVNVTVNSATVTAGSFIPKTATIQNINSNITLTAVWEQLTISQAGGINEVTINGTLQLTLTANYSPDIATDAAYAWATSNTNFATVDEDGLVTGHQAANSGEFVQVTSSFGTLSNRYDIVVKSATCGRWGLHYWNTDPNNSINGDLCFEQVGETNEWRTDEEHLFALPSNSDYEKVKVLYNGMARDYSKEWTTCRVPMIGLQGAGCGGSDGAQYAGQDAIGYFRIYEDSRDENYYLAFQPVYAITFGVDQQAGWVSVDFAHTTDAEYGTEDIVEIPSNFSSLSVYVGTKRAESNPGVNFIGGRSKTVSMNEVPNMTSGDFAGKFGKFYIHDNYCDESNFNLHFTQFYRLHYDLDGGEGTGDYSDQFAWSGATPQEQTFTLETAPTKEGYTFLRWDVSIGGGAATTMQPDDAVTLSDDAVATAIWAQNYTVTYDLAGYSTSCSSSTVHYCGEEVTVCPAPEDKTGYTFKGWNTDDITGSAADFEPGYEFIMPCNDVVFTAHYQADEYTITYEGLEGASNTNPTSYTIETPTITLQDPGARTGYNFSHWTCNDATITTIPQGSTGDMPIVAIWNAKQTNITLNHEGSATGSNNVVATYDAAMPAITIPSMAGYTFNGYFDAAKNGTQYYDNAGASVRNWDKEEATADLYAQWTPLEVQYTVKHYKQQLDGTYLLSTPDKTEVLTALAGTATTPGRSNWVGFTAPDGQKVTIAGDGSTVVNYQYTRKKYALTWVLDGGTPVGDITEGGDVYYDAPITYPTTVKKDGYCFMGWTYSTGTKQPSTMPHEALTITARWAAYENYRTYCGDAVTFYAQNGTEPEETFVITTDNGKITTPTLLETGFTQPEGWVLLGWTKVGGDPKDIVAPNTTKVDAADGDEYNAVWTHIAITGNVLTTSAVGVQVGTTIHVEGTTNKAYGLRVSFVDTKETDDPSDDVTYGSATGQTAVTQSDFRLASTSYTYIDDNIIRIEGTAAGDTHSSDYNVVYTPKTANEIDNYVLQIQVMQTSMTPLDGAVYTLNLKGRALPENFVIAEHRDSKWYALPADMNSSDTYAGKEITVEGEGMNRVVTNATLDMVYSMKTYNNDKSHVLFQSQFNQGHLWAASGDYTGIKNDAKTVTGENSAYSWMPTPQNEALDTYVMSNANNNRTLAMNGTDFGMYSSFGTNIVYFIPLKAEEYVEKEMMMVEWFPTKVLVEVDEDDLMGARAKINNVEVADVTASDTKYGTHLYEITGLNTLVDNAANKLTILYTKEATTYGHEFDIPVIVSNKTYILSSSKAENKFPWTQAVYNTADLVVRDSSVLTVDGATDAANTFGNVIIYPTSKVVVPAQTAGDKATDITMTTTTMTLFGGTDEIYDGSEYTLTKYGVPQLVLNGKLVHNETTSGLVYDVRLDAAQYYNFALPYSSKYELVTDNKGGEDFTFWTKVYDGATRAAGNNGWVWYNWNADPWAINIGTGYMFAAQPYAGQNYIIIRHPMGYDATENADGHRTSTAEATKAAVDVYAYPSTYNNNAGWNFIANPFMANFTKDLGDGTTGTIQTGNLVKHNVNEKWDGHYEWEEGSMTVRYVTLYNNGTDTYTQLPMSTAELAPFTGFFVQMAEEGTIVFDISGRTNAAPARMLNDDELPSEMEIFLHAAGQGQKDETVLFLSNGLQRDNAKEFPNEMTKQENAGTLNFYTYGGETKMYANGMSYADGQTWSNAGLMVAKEGSYTFSVTGADNEHVSHVILRDKYSNTEYDLKHTDAEIYLEAGEVNDRFDVKLVLDEHGVTTELDNVHDNNNPEKFIYNDKMFIRVNGRIYDATGKRVNK
ncbi:MAG: InlB B-repeat-containing protein [Paludibacteraceae bacterium]|nr:InlB B-repeat-containing protein [Paludibacteraceae bacterium]